MPATPIRSTRKSDLIADVAGECDTLANRQRVFADVLATWTMPEMHMLRARLETLGYTVPVGQKPRRPDLIAAFVSAREYIARAPAVSKRTRKDTCPSAGACSSGHSVRARRGRARTHALAHAALARTPGQQ